MREQQSGVHLQRVFAFIDWRVSERVVSITLLKHDCQQGKETTTLTARCCSGAGAGASKSVNTCTSTRMAGPDMLLGNFGR